MGISAQMVDVYRHSGVASAQTVNPALCCAYAEELGSRRVLYDLRGRTSLSSHSNVQALTTFENS
ncbi:hypothetical protein, conserved [Eimeria tenella]|uniref:Uncharacterized protein n=1 Tax=Eimeria tenella TaxID=5802 RepID=U6L1Q1_EIMTE|nr:hypothetical protein, conserved [Eimeria tenella]CDJ42509.1 hypothetical protein, conserved [Eimeria tenella]|eukprot:XP_013233259.1 hypothetical protein, conserved [Eimeria tenella]